MPDPSGSSTPNALMGCGHPFSAVKKNAEGNLVCGECFKEPAQPDPADLGQDWKTPCLVCDAVPTMPLTGMCGPCTFGEAATAGGEW